MSERNNDEFTGFERQLAQLVPHRSRVDRETFLFRAGQESIRAETRQPPWAGWLWPLTTAALTIVSAGLSWQLFARGELDVVDSVTVVERSAAALEAEPTFALKHSDAPRSANADTTYVRDTPALSRDHYLLRRELALTVGMDAFTAPATFREQEPADVSSYRELRSTYTESSSHGGEKKSEKDAMSNSRYTGEQT